MEETGMVIFEKIVSEYRETFLQRAVSHPFGLPEVSRKRNEGCNFTHSLSKLFMLVGALIGRTRKLVSGKNRLDKESIPDCLLRVALSAYQVLHTRKNL